MSALLIVKVKTQNIKQYFDNKLYFKLTLKNNDFYIKILLNDKT